MSILGGQGDVEPPATRYQITGATALKLLVFAHTPPPFHGQSHMVQLLLEGLRSRLAEGVSSLQDVVHVNARVSGDSADIGKFQPQKLLLLARYCATAVWLRARGATNALYYVPAPAKRSALYRDWLVMLLCKPVFPVVILHWHGVGLGEWLETQATRFERAVTRALLGRAALSIVLSEFARADAEKLSPHQVAVIPNGIPDPCPDYNEVVLPARRARLAERREAKSSADGAGIFRLLFLASCTAEKGLFAALDAVALASAAGKTPRVHLTVAGDFVAEADRREFEQRIATPELRDAVTYAGFVAEAQKTELLRNVDALLFPSLYPHEGQPVSIIEALAHGLPVIATRWRAVPELLEGCDGILVDGQSPGVIADAIATLVYAEVSTSGRERFSALYRIDRHLDAIERALGAVSGR